MKINEHCIKLLKQPSTVRGIIVLLGAVGCANVDIQHLTDVLGLCAGLLGIVEVLRDENKGGE